MRVLSEISRVERFICAFAIFGPLWIPAAQASGQAPVRSKVRGSLDAEIESLLKSEIEADDDKAEVARVQELFAKYGIPSSDQADTLSAMDFVVLLAFDQPLTFMKTAAPAVEKAVAAGRLPANSASFFRANLHQEEVKAGLGAPKNSELKKQIDSLLQVDQAVRQSQGLDLQKMQKQDQEDRPVVKAILDRYGMPTFEAVGTDAASAFVVLIQHQPAEFRREALPKLKTNVDAGQAFPKDYAMMYDRAQTDEGKPEMYGMNLICEPDGTFSPGTLVDPEHVEDRRAAIGLMPLAIYIRIATVIMPNFCKVVSK
jgi:hypothetical protein